VTGATQTRVDVFEGGDQLMEGKLAKTYRGDVQAVRGISFDVAAG
jgi:hypothetical protein